MLPELPKAYIVQAFTEFDRTRRGSSNGALWESVQSSHFAIQYNNKQYPAKTIISLASGVAVSRFSWSEAYRLLIHLGFRLLAVERDIREWWPNWGLLYKEEGLDGWQPMRRRRDGHREVMITSLGFHYPSLPHVHLRYIYETHKYYLPAKECEPYQHHVKYIAFYDRTAYGGDGAITHVANVRGFEVRPLLEICPRARMIPISNDPQYVYNLLEIRTLNSPIRNSAARGPRVTMPRIRWSSELGLFLAGNLHEATLETEPEWKLLKLLDANGIRISIQTEAKGDPIISSLTMRYPAMGTTNPHGRSWFTVGDHRVHFGNASGFVLDDGIFEYPFARLDEALRFLARAPTALTARSATL